MARNISASEAAARLEQSGFNSQDRYQKGVSGKGSLWASRTGASEASWQSGVQQAIAAKRFTKELLKPDPPATIRAYPVREYKIGRPECSKPERNIRKK